MAILDAEIAVFKKYLPEGAVNYCFDLWKRYNFYFKITPKRESKLGDYRFFPATGRHAITVNGNLNPFSFLVTYIHEVAHLETKVLYKQRVAPHGPQWKKRFQELMYPMMNTDVFPPEVLRALNQYMQDPKASSCADPVLMKALQSLDAPDGMVHVSDLPHGNGFTYKGRLFVKQKTNRTRIACVEAASGRTYSFSAAALVMPYGGPATSLKPVSKDLALGALADEAKFSFRQRVFVKKELRRTMVRCQEVATGRYYLISKEALVTLV
jgi:SprT protein